MATTASTVLAALMAAEPVARCEYSRLVVAAQLIEKAGCAASVLHETMRGLTEWNEGAAGVPRALTFYAASSDRRFVIFRLNPAYLDSLKEVASPH